MVAGGGAIATRIRGRLAGRRAGFADYEAFFKAEQLSKFSAGEAGFVAVSRRRERCADCVHWFINPHTEWSPCEILRRPNNQPVPAPAVCRFFNQDGRNYPLLNVL